MRIKEESKARDEDDDTRIHVRLSCNDDAENTSGVFNMASRQASAYYVTPCELAHPAGVLVASEK